MTTPAAQSAGGKACAIIQRRKALENYYKNPVICLYCNKIVPVRDDQKVHNIKERKFCNQSCAALYNNSKRIKTSKKERYLHNSCLMCGGEIRSRNKVSGRKYCTKCSRIASAKNGLNELLTKAELRQKRKNYGSFRNTIRRLAQRTYFSSGLPHACKICGYDKTFDVSHIKPVSKFPESAFLLEINALDNLVALCPNHHWEFDHGLIKI